MTVRRLRATDLEQASAVCMASFLEAVAPSLSPLGIETFTGIVSMNGFADRMSDDNDMFVFETAGRVVGVAELMGGQLTLSPGSLLALLGIAASAALIISALLIAVGIYARTFKEAQTYIAPITMLVVLPAVMLQFADFLTFGLGVYAVPVIGGMIAILETVRGAAVPSHALIAIGANLLAALLLSLLALRSFGREEVIFRN